MSLKLLSSIAISGVLLSLVACSSTPASTDASGGDCTAAAAGSSSEKITAKGDFETAPEVEFPEPLTATSTERSVLIEGDGADAAPGSTLTVQYSAYNATSGKEIEVTSYDEAGEVKFTLTEGELLPGLLKGLGCASVGDRIATVIPPDDAFGEQGQSDLEIAGTDSIIFVLDVIDVAAPVAVLERADGEDQPVQEGLPTVELADDGEPTVTIPESAAPTDLQIAVLKQGDGVTVADGASVTVHYAGVLWASGEEFDSSWTRGEPATFSTDGVVEGFSAALVGQTVGSQVLAVIPPAQGYGENPPASSGIEATDTLVFVIDILASR